MSQTQDEHIECASCGTSFVFSAAEAQIFAERQLVAPKRCKACRKARKEQGGSDRGADRGGDRSNGNAGPRGRFPRSTGDVNEYRSPMADPSFTPGYAARPVRGGPPRAGGARAPGGAPRRPFGGRDDGNYRSPSFPDARPFAGAPRAQGPRGGAPRFAEATARPVQREPAAPKKRQVETFSITCNSCGKAAEVPFKPAEGRDVFCQDCYRARKPAPV